MLELVGGAPGGGETPREVHRASDCKTLASHPAHAVHRLIWPAAVQTFLFYDPSLHSSAARDSFGANAHSANLQPQKATAGVEHPTLRVAALITAIGTKNTEPPGAGDTTETSLPPSEPRFQQKNTSKESDARSQHNTQARARAAIHSLRKKRSRDDSTDDESEYLRMWHTLISSSRGPPRHTLTPTPPTALTARYRYHGLP